MGTQPNFLYRTGDNKYNHFNINRKKQHYFGIRINMIKDDYLFRTINIIKIFI